MLCMMPARCVTQCKVRPESVRGRAYRASADMNGHQSVHRYGRNIRGRDFVVGNVRGCFSTLDTVLKERSVDRTVRFNAWFDYPVFEPPWHVSKTCSAFKTSIFSAY